MNRNVRFLVLFCPVSLLCFCRRSAPFKYSKRQKIAGLTHAIMTGNSERSSRGDEGLREEVIKNVRSLLISARNGLTVAELQKDYNDMVKKPLPFRELGYKTPLDMLKDMPNVARPTWENGILILKGIADAATRHIASLVERQKKTSPKRKTRLTTYRPESLPVVPHFIRTQIKELLSSYPSGLLGSMFCIAFNRRFGQELNYSTLRFQSLGHLLESIPDIARIEDMKGRRGFRVYGRGVDVNLGVKTVDPGDSFPSRTTSSPTFAQTTMERRNSKPTPDVNDNNHDNKMKETSSIKLKLDKRSGIDEKIQDECKQVLVKRPNGIWAARFATEYKKLHNKELNIKQLGFMSMVEFMSAMPDVVRIERPTKIDWLLFMAKDADIDHSESNGEVSVPVETGEKDPVPLLCPSLPDNPLNLPDGVGRGTYFSKIKPPECGYIEVCVTHVMDPHRFWVMMIENWPKLQALTEDIRQFYSSRESSRYRMPDWFVSVGQACCALYEDGSWYRGLVVGIHSVESIEVFYVDYGNKARLPLSSLRVLRSQFMKLPAQALPSKLAYIKPFDGGKEWSAGAIHRFYHLTKNYKNLVGLVCGVKEEVLSLCLCDTNESEDLHINDELVSEEYATCPEINSPETPSPDGQDQNRNGVKEQQQELITQNVPMQLTLEQQMYLKQHAINVQPLLSDIPAYPQDITSWLNQTAPYTNHFVNSQLNYSSSNMAPYVAYKDDLSFVEEINQELELNMPSNEGIVKRIKVANDFVFHVIKFEEKPYIISAEISALFWDSDLLRSMLRQKKKTLAKVVVSFAENKELFEVLIRCNIPGVSDGDEPRSFVTLYELEGVPEILKTFDHPSEELLTDFLAEIDCFKKEKEDYWLVEKEEEELKLGSEATSSSEDQFLESELGIDELQLLLQAMQFRRKRILQGLMTGGHCTDSTGGTVDELQEVEIQIEGLRQEILVKERKI